MITNGIRHGIDPAPTFRRRWTGTAGVAAIALLAMASAACAQSATPGVRTAATAARCDTTSDDKLLVSELSASAVQGVQPLYSHLAGSSKGGDRLVGAVLTVTPLPGVTAEWLDHALECRVARSSLAQTPEASNDPFSLPFGSVDIDVRSAKDAFEIALTGSSPADAREILSRANAFATSRSAVAQQVSLLPAR